MRRKVALSGEVAMRAPAPTIEPTRLTGRSDSPTETTVAGSGIDDDTDTEPGSEDL
jgi:hypothetical protein